MPAGIQTATRKTGFAFIPFKIGITGEYAEASILPRAGIVSLEYPKLTVAEKTINNKIEDRNLFIKKFYASTKSLVFGLRNEI